MTPETRRNIFRYGIAIDLVVVATGVGLLLPPSPLVLLSLFAAAVLVSVWKGGWQGGLTALVLSVVALALTFSLDMETLALFAFAMAGLIAVWSAAARPQLSNAVPVAAQPATDEYEVQCFTCGVAFNAAEADWCSCLTKERTLVCTNCLTCFCKAPPAYHEKLRAAAPPRLFERKPGEAPPANPAAADVARPLVLCVDGDKNIHAIVHRVCTSLGYGFVHASTGQEGLARAREYRPKLILADAFLPGIDGRELCRVLKDDPAFAETRMVVMTGLYTDTKYRAEAMKRFRVDDYVAQPVARTDLISLMEKHIEGVTGLPVQEDLYELHRKDVASAPARPDAYEIDCANCGKTFDAARAEWCGCAGRDGTLVCTHCSRCFCTAQAAYKERFWLDAPPTLFERKTIGAKRSASAGNPPAVQVKRPLILLAGDDENVRHMVRTVATTMGFGFVTAANAQGALALAREYKPDLVLADALVRGLDARELGRRAKLVTMTGQYAGKDDTVAKPVAVGDLIQLFKKHLPQEVAAAQ